MSLVRAVCVFVRTNEVPCFDWIKVTPPISTLFSLFTPNDFLSKLFNVRPDLSKRNLWPRTCKTGPLLTTARKDIENNVYILQINKHTITIYYIFLLRILIKNKGFTTYLLLYKLLLWSSLTSWRFTFVGFNTFTCKLIMCWFVKYTSNVYKRRQLVSKTDKKV